MEKIIATYSQTRDIIKKYNFSLSKKLGQNFLVDINVLNKIITKSQITKDDFILEIGPGIGSLTQALAENAGYVVAVEKDKKLIPILADTLSNYKNIEIINDDILSVDLNKLILNKNNGKKIKVVANLPYYITTPIIMSLLENKIPITCITVMVQKEVAKRITAASNTEDYGAISLAVLYYANTEIIANVPKNCFIPRPNVSSSVVKIDVLEKPSVDVEDEKLMFKLIKAAFGQRRKTLINSIYNQTDLEFTKEELGEIIAGLALDVNVRGEELKLSQFAQLTNCIIKKIKPML